MRARNSTALAFPGMVLGTSTSPREGPHRRLHCASQAHHPLGKPLYFLRSLAPQPLLPLSLLYPAVLLSFAPRVLHQVPKDPAPAHAARHQAAEPAQAAGVDGLCAALHPTGVGPPYQAFALACFLAGSLLPLLACLLARMPAILSPKREKLSPSVRFLPAPLFCQPSPVGPEAR